MVVFPEEFCMVQKEKKYQRSARWHMNLVAKQLPKKVLSTSCVAKTKVLVLKIEAMNE